MINFDFSQVHTNPPIEELIYLEDALKCLIFHIYIVRRGKGIPVSSNIIS